MSWMITSTDDLSGTCYMEVLPGPYRDACWNSTSVFFEEEPFAYFERVIAKYYTDYDHYAFAEIPADTWKAVISELRELALAIDSGATTRDIADRLGFLLQDSKDRFLGEERLNLDLLRKTIDDFTVWLEAQLDSNDVVSVLGM